MTIVRTRHGWSAETDVPRKLWAFFDRFRIDQATLLGWWRKDGNGVLLVIGTWHPPRAAWLEMIFDVALHLNRRRLGLPRGKLKATDILTGEDVDITRPVSLADMQMGRMIGLRR